MNKFHITLRPVQKIALAFLAIMLLGGFILAMPFCWNEGYEVRLVDAMFSSFSAVCVTGLATVEIGLVFSMTGQLVMLALIQIGGLGIMTATSLIFMALGKRFSLSDRLTMQESLNEDKLQGVVRMTRSATFLTFGCELAGAALLSIRFIPEFGWAKGIYYSVFHAVSAFCNAGFDVFGKGTNFMPYAQDPLVLITIMALIVVGGLGFLVVLESGRWAMHGFRGRLSLQAKVVLIATLFLIVAGIVIICVVEWNNPETLGIPSFSAGDKILNGAFQSVTTRTAGFSSFRQGEMHSVSALVTILLMFIGASPAGTGGGVKTTTCVVMLSLLVAIIRGREDVTMLRRRINWQTVLRSIAIILLGMIFVGVMTLIVTTLEANRFDTSRIFFEVVSAFGTVGLSQELTPLLSSASKVAIIFCMYAGRVGLMTVMTAISMRMAKGNGKIRYAEERIMVG